MSMETYERGPVKLVEYGSYRGKIERAEREVVLPPGSHHNACCKEQSIMADSQPTVEELRLQAQRKFPSASEKLGRCRALRMYPEDVPCERCGAQHSERHHKDGDTLNNAPSNIARLCRKCHMAEDGRAASFSETGKENLDAFRRARSETLGDTTALRTGSPCPVCNKPLAIIGSHVVVKGKRKKVGCRKERGGCGYYAGQYMEVTL